MVARHAAVAQGDDRQRGVPHRRLARFQAPALARGRAHFARVVAVLEHEALQAFQAAAHDRVLQRIAAQVQRHQGVHPRRLDPAPGAIGLLAANDPALGAAQREPAQQPQRAVFVGAKRAVQAQQPRRPCSARAARSGVAPGAVQLGEVERQPPRRPVGFDERQRHDRLARPAGEVIDVQWHPRGQQHDLRGQRGDVLPRPQPEQCQPHVREHTRALQAAALADEACRGAHVLRIWWVARQAQRPVGLDGRGQLAGTAVEVGPCAVRALLGADPGRRAPRLVLATDAQELAQEHVLRVHGHVRLQLPLPPAALVLKREQPRAGQLERDLCPAGSLHRRRSHRRKPKSFRGRTTSARTS